MKKPDEKKTSMIIKEIKALVAKYGASQFRYAMHRWDGAMRIKLSLEKKQRELAAELSRVRERLR